MVSLLHFIEEKNHNYNMQFSTRMLTLPCCHWNGKCKQRMLPNLLLPELLAFHIFFFCLHISTRHNWKLICTLLHIKWNTKFNQTPIKIDIFVYTKILSPTNTSNSIKKAFNLWAVGDWKWKGGCQREIYTYFDRLYILMSCVHSPFFWSGKFAMVIYSVPTTIQKWTEFY